MNITREASIFVEEATDAEFEAEVTAVTMFYGHPTGERTDRTDVLRVVQWEGGLMGALNLYHVSRPEPVAEATEG